MSEIRIYKKGITHFNVDCIVNAANCSLAYGAGVCGAIFEAAGISELSTSCAKIGHCNTGDAVITPSFNLKNTKYIIHAVGPIYSYLNLQKCRNQLYSAYRRSLEVMIENNCRSIAFPLISSGIFGYPIEEARRIALKACKVFIAQHADLDISIYFAVLDDERYDIGTSILNNL